MPDYTSVTVTGTQGGVTDPQDETLERLLSDDRIRIVHHGDCVGVDLQAHLIALELGKSIEIHPPKDPKKRAWCGAQVGLPRYPGQVFVHPEDEYIARNHAMVDVSGFVIAVPATPHEVVRSGTWATFRYAQKVGRPSAIIYPDGTWRVFPDEEIELEF